MRKLGSLKSPLIRERGAATLLVAVVLLISITLVVLTTAQTVVTEQRIIANEERAKQAFEAAAAGLSYGTGYFQTNGADADGNDVIDTLLAAPNWTYVSGSSGPSYRVRFVQVDAGSLDRVTIEAQGRSDDQSAIRSMSETISGTPAVANAPGNPLTSRGFVDLKGSGTITNLESNMTIWSGDSIDVTGNSPKTVIKHPLADGGIESTNKNNKGLDIVDNDPSLSTLTDDEFFQNFLGLTPADYKDSVARTVVDPDTTSMSSLDGEKATVIWVDGDARFTSNTTIGTADDPVILIVDGLMEGAGNVTVNGVLFVTGNWSGSGNLTVNGATVVRGDVDGTGSLDVIFNSSLLDNLATIGKAVAMPGTWRDW
jgi:FlaG/FlaF family flagellin (archaellin)